MNKNEKMRIEIKKSQRRSKKTSLNEGKVQKQSAVKMNPISKTRNTSSANSRRALQK